MDPKLYKTLELVFIAALLVAVLYLGSVFTGQPTPTPVPPRPPPQPTIASVIPTSQPRFIVTRAGPPSPTPSARPLNYTIVSGDTCIAIATRFGVSLQSLMESNNLDGECLIFAGDTLTIPLPTPTIAP